MKLRLALPVLVALCCAPAFAQTPVGSTGQCKDGTYTNAPSKAGACSGHKGVKDWYAAAPAKAEKAPKAAKTAAPPAATAAAPAPSPAKTAPAAPAAKPTAAVAASGPAPAGATGQCKDGTYSTAPTKAGACSGHKGVAQWYAAATAPAPKPTPAAAPAPVSKPAPAPTPAAAPATAAAPKPARAVPAPPANAAPGGGPGMVWVNTDSKIYHCPSDRYYGKTKKGQYMTEAAAKAMGARADANKPCGL